MILPPPGFMEPNPQPALDFGLTKVAVRPEMATTPEFAWVEFACGCGMYLERSDEHGIWYPPAELMPKICHSPQRNDHTRAWRDFWDWKHSRRR